jgi:peptidoglycan/LPS O-acetylase OafA/YrhL
VIDPAPKMQNAKLKPVRMIELDFIRGVSILLVLLHHFNFSSTDFLGLSSLGSIGVDMFFVLSGFLVGGLLLKEWRKTKTVDGFRFLKRRAFKIWPAYYFYVFFAIIFHTHPFHSLIGNLLNIQNYTGTPLGHTWTLAVEEHFYLLLTLFMIFACAKGWSPQKVVTIFLVVMVCVAAIRMAQIHGGNLSVEYTHIRIDSLLYGVVFAVVFNFWPDLFAAMQGKKLLLWMVIGGCYLLRSITWWPILYIGITLTDIGCAAFLLLMFRPLTCTDRSWLYRVVAFIGVYSYGIYLWHMAAGGLMRWVGYHIPGPAGAWFGLIAPYPAAILFGVLITKAIEFPFLKLRDKLIPSPIGSHLLPDSAAPREPDKAW